MAEYVRVSSHVGSKKIRDDLVWGKSAKCCGCLLYINRRDLFVAYFIKGNACISMGGVFNRHFGALFHPLPVDLLKKKFNHISMMKKKVHI